jgi:hypothetical protein
MYHTHPTPVQIWCGLMAAGVEMTDAQWEAAMSHAGEQHAGVKHDVERALFNAQTATTRMASSLKILRESEAA